MINPLVPYVNDFPKNIPTITARAPAASPTWASPRSSNQTFRLLSHDRLHRAVEIWEERYPGVDIILIEPELDDEPMFGTSTSTTGPAADRQAWIRVGDDEARPRLRPLQGRSLSATGSDLGPPRAPRPRPGRARQRPDVGLAPGARAHHGALLRSVPGANAPRAPTRRPPRTSNGAARRDARGSAQRQIRTRFLDG